MMKANFFNLAEISKLKKGNISIFTKGGKIYAKAPSKEIANDAFNNISDFLDDVNMIRLDLKPELARKLNGFELIKR